MKITVEPTRAERRRLRIQIQRTDDAGLRTRLSIILHLSRGRLVISVADRLHVARSTVYSVVERFWGALDVRDRRLAWVSATHNRSGLFIDLLRRLKRTYPRARRIHVIVDNYGVHSSRQTELALAAMPRIVLHFLPPYSPRFNPIERVWLDLHANVTRNQCCTTIEALMANVRAALQRRNRETTTQHRNLA